MRLEGRYVDAFVFPAEPGYERLVFRTPRDADPETFDVLSHIKRMPVIGWSLTYDGYGYAAVAAITPNFDGAEWASDEYRGVLLPDGRVLSYSVTHEEYVYASLDVWVSAIRANWANDRKRRAELAEKTKPCPHCGRGSADDLDLDLIPF